jgi:hypothetical protein
MGGAPLADEEVRFVQLGRYIQPQRTNAFIRTNTSVSIRRDVEPKNRRSEVQQPLLATTVLKTKKFEQEKAETAERRKLKR